MTLKNRMPRHIRYFYNPDRHPDPIPEDFARSSSWQAWNHVNKLSGMARLMLWEMVVRKYGDELRTKMLKQQQMTPKQNARARQK